MVIEVVNMSWDDMNNVYANNLVIHMSEVMSLQQYMPSMSMPLSDELEYCKIELRNDTVMIVNEDYDRLSSLYKIYYDGGVTYSVN
tara:strand:- start:129 stop:386 length:258 start_codon:yes stop_codon:yes gene_type:complete